MTRRENEKEGVHITEEIHTKNGSKIKTDDLHHDMKWGKHSGENTSNDNKKVK